MSQKSTRFRRKNKDTELGNYLGNSKISFGNSEDKKQEVEKKTKTKKPNINNSHYKENKKSANKFKLFEDSEYMSEANESENLYEAKTGEGKKSKAKSSKEEFNPLGKKTKRNKGSDDNKKTSYQQKLEGYKIDSDKEPKYATNSDKFKDRFNNNSDYSVMTCEEALKNLYGKSYKGNSLLKVLEEIREDNGKLKKLIDGWGDPKNSANAMRYRLIKMHDGDFEQRTLTVLSTLLNFKDPDDLVKKILEIYPELEQKDKFIRLFQYFPGANYLRLFGAIENEEDKSRQQIKFGNRTFFVATLRILGFIKIPQNWYSGHCKVNEDYKEYLPSSVKKILGQKSASDLRLPNIVNQPCNINTKEQFNKVLANVIRPVFENISKLSVQTKLGHFKRIYNGISSSPTYSTLLFFLGRVSAKWLVHTDKQIKDETNALAEMIRLVERKDRTKKQSSLNKMERDDFLKLHFAPLYVDLAKGLKEAKSQGDIQKINKKIDKLDKIIEQIRGRCEEIKLELSKKRSKSENKDSSKNKNKGGRSKVSKSKSVGMKNKKTTKSNKLEETSINTTQEKNKKITKQTSRNLKEFVNQDMIIELEIDKNEIDSNNENNNFGNSQAGVNGEKENNQNIMSEPKPNTNKIYNNTNLQNDDKNNEIKETKNYKKEEEIKPNENKNNSEILQQLPNGNGENSTNGQSAFYDKFNSLNDDPELEVYRDVFPMSNFNNKQNDDEEINHNDLYFTKKTNKGEK